MWEEETQFYLKGQAVKNLTILQITQNGLSFSFSILFFNLLLLLPGDGGVGGSQKVKQTWKKQKGIVVRVHDAKVPEKSIKMLCEKIYI